MVTAAPSNQVSSTITRTSAMLGAEEPHTMLLLVLQLAWLGGVLVSRPGSQNSIEIILPEKVQGSAQSKEGNEVSYIIPINQKPHMVHLKQKYFLADHFVVYLYKQGSVTSHSSDIPAQCYYHGYIEGYPSSVATLSTCSGLRGMLQFENVSYGIEPLESAVEFQHILYKLGNENNVLESFNERGKTMEENQVDYSIFISKKVSAPPPNLLPLYLEMIIVVDKGLYDYLGSDRVIVTNKVIEMVSLINSMFTQFNVTVVLSSLELWSDKNKISTNGEADELLKRFLEWQQSYLALRPHDVSYLLIYKDHPNYVGATFPGKMCVSHYSVGIAQYSRDMTLEAFSVTVTQMLGINLGISYDDPQKCHCSEAVCVMSPKAVQSSVLKTFSNCSQRDFQAFISNMGSKCLQNKPQLQAKKTAVCGNGKVEGDEICDCGTAEQCGSSSCCTPGMCVLKPTSQCDGANPNHRCCDSCKFAAESTECRPVRHPDCDLPEKCNGSSGFCPPDIHVLNGNMCKGDKYFCHDGICHDLDQRCENVFGTGSTNGPFSCYEEIQSQTDRFGNCGKDLRGRFTYCGWRNLICGRLICAYGSRKPFIPTNNATAVVYAYVRDTICITADFSATSNEGDPLLLRSGPICDDGRICVNFVCVEARALKTQAETCAQKCNGNGVCTNSEDLCKCKEGFNPPDCKSPSKRSSVWTGKGGVTVEGISPKAEKKWLLGLYIGLPALVMATLVVVAWNNWKKWFAKKEECQSSK
ncbi:PREDICTED: disintegrin and metalloproteinase domain-containing protein 32 [Dipodomys ordii]|uniref:Disintegrin and metalloproteinase domain-containing protein 32 n=1 Tax=Dipodomys ordii TaxID=10020 RepID=A0A1S3FTT8_DIPOR|nr:PREDICTED: disintegrin and metalloproteinase domain-containing protein 32 [Dipodomys ordii]